MLVFLPFQSAEKCILYEFSITYGRIAFLFMIFVETRCEVCASVNLCHCIENGAPFANQTATKHRSPFCDEAGKLPRILFHVSFTFLSRLGLCCFHVCHHTCLFLLFYSARSVRDSHHCSFRCRMFISHFVSPSSALTKVFAARYVL